MKLLLKVINVVSIVLTFIIIFFKYFFFLFFFQIFFSLVVFGEFIMDVMGFGWTESSICAIGELFAKFLGEASVSRAVMGDLGAQTI